MAVMVNPPKQPDEDINPYVAAQAAWEQGDDVQCWRRIAAIIDKDLDRVEAFELGVRACLRLARSNRRPEAAEGFSKMMAFVARYEEGARPRSLMEYVFRYEMIEPDAILVLLAIISVLLQPHIRSIEHQAKPGAGFRPSAADDGAPENGVDLIEILEKTMGSITLPTLIGSTELTPEVRAVAQRGHIHEVLRALMSSEMRDRGSSDEIYFGQRVLLHVLIRLGIQFHDPSADFLGLHYMIEYWAGRGEHQRCRDLAETAWMNLSRLDDHGADRGYRLTLAWLCWAEASHRVHQPINAAQMLCYALVLRPQPMARDWALRLLSLCSRVMRDLGAPPLAKELLMIRRRVLEAKFGRLPKAVELEWEVTMLGVEAKMTGGDLAGTERVLSKAMKLLARSNEKERASIVSVAVGACDRIETAGGTVDPAVKQQLESALSSLPESLETSFRTLLRGGANSGELRTILRALPPAKYAMDVVAALFPHLPLAFATLRQAVRNGDREQFLLAANVLGQPGLSMGKSSVPRANASNDGIESGEVHSLSAIADVALEYLHKSLRSEESFGILALDEEHRLYVMTGSDRATALPDKPVASVWSEKEYDRWKDDGYPGRYGAWIPIEDPFGPPESPSPEEVDRSLRGLRSPLNPGYQPVAVIPTSQLFGFPFALLSDVDGIPLGRQRPFSVVPSVSWLIDRRRTPAAGDGRRCAWLGSGQSTDLALAMLRAKLESNFRTHGVELVTDESPARVAGSSLAILASHGGMDETGYFTTVSDRESEASAEGFAQGLNGCACVLLLVCSAGNMKPRRSSYESHGLAAALLTKGVGAVIACSWPLATDVALQFTGPFLEALANGHTVDTAVWSANRVIHDRYPNPCAYAALQVYGDGAHRLPPLKAV